MGMMISLKCQQRVYNGVFTLYHCTYSYCSALSLLALYYWHK